MIYFRDFLKKPSNPRFNHMFFGFNHLKPGFLNRALDPQAAVWIGWIGARFVPDFRFLKKSMVMQIRQHPKFDFQKT